MAPFSGCTVVRGAGALDLLSCINRNGNAIMSQAAQSERPTEEGGRGKGEGGNVERLGTPAADSRNRNPRSWNVPSELSFQLNCFTSR